jgi:hypothetical protein
MVRIVRQGVGSEVEFVEAVEFDCWEGGRGAALMLVI